MDNELFELCKEVFEKTGWDRYKLPSGQEQWIREAWWTLNGGQPQPVDKYKLMKDQFVAPLYTSDYLLEKLGELFYITIENHGFGKTSYWEASHISDDDNGSRQSDTPLKALLKLTLALREAGELK